MIEKPLSKRADMPMKENAKRIKKNVIYYFNLFLAMLYIKAAEAGDFNVFTELGDRFFQIIGD